MSAVMHLCGLDQSKMSVRTNSSEVDGKVRDAWFVFGIVGDQDDITHNADRREDDGIQGPSRRPIGHEANCDCDEACYNVDRNRDQVGHIRGPFWIEALRDRWSEQAERIETVVKQSVPLSVLHSSIAFVKTDGSGRLDDSRDHTYGPSTPLLPPTPSCTIDRRAKHVSQLVCVTETLLCRGEIRTHKQ